MGTPEDTTSTPEDEVSTSADAREEQDASEGQDPRIPIVQNWHEAKDQADHYNRNLMQYGGAVAAVLSILAGSGGIFAVATALKVGPDPIPLWVLIIVWGVSISGTIALAILTVLLFHSFFRRRRAEKAVDKNRRSLIEEDLTPFLPTTQPSSDPAAPAGT